MFTVLVVGQTGCGKSSVVNMIAEHNVAPTSNDLAHCTKHWTEYPISVGGHQFQVFDTIGFLEPEVDGMVYAEAIANTYDAINILKERGGIDMLLYCIRDSQMDEVQKMQGHYRLLHEVLCDEEVPIALVVTHRGSPMINAERYKSVFDTRKIACVDYICINIANTSGPESRPADTASQEAIRQLLMKCYDASQNSRSTAKKLSLLAKKFVGRDQSLKGKQVSTLLTRRCKMKSEVAQQLVAALNLESPQNRLYPAPYARGKCWLLVFYSVALINRWVIAAVIGESPFSDSIREEQGLPASDAR